MNNPEPVFKCVKKYVEENRQDKMNGDVYIVEESKKTHKAGVYLDRQIIHLKKGGLFSSTEVIMVNVESFTGGRRFAVYRKEEGIPQLFQKNVAEAQRIITEKNISRYNSVEFVMELLDVHLEPTASDWKKIARWSKPKGFEVVKNFSEQYRGNAEVGDLFLAQRKKDLFCHAGVCCSTPEPEIIHFMPTSAKASVASSCSGAVSKVHINVFSSGNEYAIYRLKTGILDSTFQEGVIRAMRQTNKYNLLSYNCIHFALELIYGKELKKDKNDVEILIEQFFDKS